MARLKFWQKGAVMGFSFTAVMSLVFTLILLGIDIYFSMKGLQHSCYMVTHIRDCEAADAMLSRLAFFAVFLLVFGLPVSALGGFLGWIFDRVRIK